MLPVIIVYGTLAGLIAIGAIVATLVFGNPAVTASTEWVGYLVMILALGLVFFGIKRYRDADRGGIIGFVPAVLLGLGIALVASIIYIIVWEIYLAVTNHSFITDYANAFAARLAAEGVEGAQLEAELAQLQSMQAQYANPLFRIPITFLEIFPVGLIVTLVSAALLRNPGFAPAKS